MVVHSTRLRSLAVVLLLHHVVDLGRVARAVELRRYLDGAVRRVGALARGAARVELEHALLAAVVRGAAVGAHHRDVLVDAAQPGVLLAGLAVDDREPLAEERHVDQAALCDRRTERTGGVFLPDLLAGAAVVPRDPPLAVAAGDQVDALAIRGDADEVARADPPARLAARLIASHDLLALERGDEVAADDDPRADGRVDLPHHVAAREVVRDDRLVRARPSGGDGEQPRLAGGVDRRGLRGELAALQRAAELVAVVLVGRQPERTLAAARGEERDEDQRLHLPPPVRALHTISASCRDGRGGFFGVTSR